MLGSELSAQFVAQCDLCERIITPAEYLVVCSRREIIMCTTCLGSIPVQRGQFDVMPHPLAVRALSYLDREVGLFSKSGNRDGLVQSLTRFTFQSCDEQVLSRALGTQSSARDLIHCGFSVCDTFLETDLLSECRDDLKKMTSEQLWKRGHAGGKLWLHRDDYIYLGLHDGSEFHGLVRARSRLIEVGKGLLLALCGSEPEFIQTQVAIYHGSFRGYSRHKDGPNLDQLSRNGTSRILTLILYVGDDWEPRNGGELLAFPRSASAEKNPDPKNGTPIPPKPGSLVSFESTNVWHAVLAGNSFNRAALTIWVGVGASVLLNSPGSSSNCL